MPVNIPMDIAPYRLSGRVYGTLLNHRSALAALAEQVDGAPYKGAPRAPVLYIKPRNTLIGDNAVVALPEAVAELEVAACLGIVIGRTACRLSAARALDAVAGYLIVNDISIPHSDYYRPSIRFKARDGFCPLGPRVSPRDSVASPDRLEIRTLVDGNLRLSSSTVDLLRPVGQLLADVTDFMTLSPGDVLATGAAAPAVRVRAGQKVRCEIGPLGALQTLFVAAAGGRGS
jgi:5-oxopent-3-ene-1,2,5-tricarboxylate decarboxylase / 2-hydroxyhepta-2,4-diene-1,7-dioate isomerase